MKEIYTTETMLKTRVKDEAVSCLPKRWERLVATGSAVYMLHIERQK